MQLLRLKTLGSVLTAVILQLIKILNIAVKYMNVPPSKEETEDSVDLLLWFINAQRLLGKSSFCYVLSCRVVLCLHNYFTTMNHLGGLCKKKLLKNKIYHIYLLLFLALRIPILDLIYEANMNQ